MSSMTTKQKVLAQSLSEIPDFPAKGILFRNIFPILAQPDVLQAAVDLLLEPIDLFAIDAFVGIESRGFILAAAMAQSSNKGFIPLRKAGKLPPPTHRQTYTLEYGEAELEMAHGLARIVLVDDVLATGGTLKAGLQLCQTAGFTVQDVVVLINLRHLNTLQWKGEAIKSVLQYDH